MVKNGVIFYPEAGGFSFCPVRNLLKPRLGSNSLLFPQRAGDFPSFRVMAAPLACR
jgi:hypothetical protein